MLVEPATGIPPLAPDIAARGRSRLSGSTLIVCAFIVALVGTVAGLGVWNTRQNAFREHERDATNLAFALAEQTARYVQTIDQTIMEARSWATEADRRTPAAFKDRIRTVEIRRQLIERQIDIHEGHAVVLVGSDGEVLSTSRGNVAPGVNIADRDYFKYLRSHDDASLVVGSPATSRSTGQPSLFFARRVNSPDGAFVGLVASVVEAAYLAGFYETISRRLGGAVTLLSRDGTILLRYPDLTGLAGQKLPQTSDWYSRVVQQGGSYRSAGFLDGVAALVVVQPLRDYPLVVNVIVPEAVILASWRRQAIFIGIGALAIAVAFIALTCALAAQFQRQWRQTGRLKHAAENLIRSERKSRMFAEMSADWFWEQGADFRFVRDANIPLTSQPTDVGKTRWDLGDPAMDQNRWTAHMADLAARLPFRDFRWERIRTDGKRGYMSTSGEPIFDDMGTFLGYQGTGRDITIEVVAAVELREAKERAEQAEALLRDAVDSMSESFVIYDRDDRFVMCNEGYRETHRKIYAEGADWLVPGAYLGDILGHVIANGGGGKAAHGREAEWVAERLRFHRRASGAFEQRVDDGSWYLVTNRRMKNGGVAGLRIDITERKRSEERVLHLAHHDALTGLPNRSLLNDRLTQALALAEHSDRGVAVLALDLNRFKAINDGFGHAAGDRLLQLVSERLKGAIRTSDTLARVGGDEFVLVLSDADPTAAGELARRLLEELSQPFQMNDLRMRIGTSIGIAMFPTNGDNAETLLNNADTALYRTKLNRKDGFCFFERIMDLELRERWSLEQDLRLAIGTDQLWLNYQPIFSGATRSILGFEALLRWRHPSRGDIPPTSFIPIAEETGLIVPIGTSALEEACRTAAMWSPPTRIAVNLSAAQLLSGELSTRVADILRDTGLSPALLELEVTETMLISDHDLVLATLNELRAMGVRIACDDFGTGYSSFSYIQKLSFDRLKIDQSFVGQLGKNPTASKIIKAILAMARSLDMDVTAEGVETEQQLAMLRALGCEEMQGFLLGRPMSATKIPAALRGDD